MSNSIDWDKPIQTQDGREVRIYTTDGVNSDTPVVGEFVDEYGNWLLFRRPLDGRLGNTESCTDLVNVPQKYAIWVNVYRPNNSEGIRLCSHDSRSEASKFSRAGELIACIKVTFTEGEGLEIDDNL